MFVTMNNDRKDKFSWVDWMVRERKRKKWKQADLARETGLTRTTISDYEKRKRPNPDVGALASISEALGYDDDYLPRLAGLLKFKPDRDPWAERVLNTLKRAPLEARALGEKLAEALAEGEEIDLKPKPKTKSATR